MEKEKILEIRDLSITHDSDQTLLKIEISGTVSSSGWKNIALIPHIIEKSPSDGIYDYDLMAEPSSGLSLPVTMDIEKNFYIHSVPLGLKGIRVHSSTNTKVFMLS